VCSRACWGNRVVEGHGGGGGIGDVVPVEIGEGP